MSGDAKVLNPKRGDMKIEAEVLAVESNGDVLFISTQGKTTDSAGWRALERHTFKVPMTIRNSRAFYVGRKLEIEIRPKGR